MWLEMSRDPEHGGEGWEFSKCLWSPSRKSDGAKWGHWETLLQAHYGELVLHLKGIGANAAFVGVSSIAREAVEVLVGPPIPKQWVNAPSFYHILLENFEEFTQPIFLQKVFKEKDSQLRDYFVRNKESKKEKLKLFYGIQGGRLQCHNGAYLSYVDSELATILLPQELSYGAWAKDLVFLGTESVRTGQRTTNLITRIGQEDFSRSVRQNYNSQCCFPNCNVADNRFLVGAHIARWADATSLRGEISNGLCLCLMHDKAFESGLFTIDSNFAVHVDESKCLVSNWCAENLIRFHGQQIRLGTIKPSLDALRHHWVRTNQSLIFGTG